MFVKAAPDRTKSASVVIRDNMCGSLLPKEIIQILKHIKVPFYGPDVCVWNYYDQSYIFYYNWIRFLSAQFRAVGLRFLPFLYFPVNHF